MPGHVRRSDRASDHPTFFDPSSYRKCGDIRPTFNQSQPVVVHCSNKHSLHRTRKSSKPVIIHVHREGICTFTESGSSCPQNWDLHVHRCRICTFTKRGSTCSQNGEVVEISTDLRSQKGDLHFYIKCICMFTETGSRPNQRWCMFTIGCSQSRCPHTRSCSSFLTASPP